MNIDFTKMDTIFINSENSTISDPYWLLLSPEDKISLKKDKYVALSNRSIYDTWKHMKVIKIMNLSYQDQHGMTN